MAFEFATGILQIGTGAINTTYAVTTKTGTWKAIILWWSGQASATNASGEADLQYGIGVATDATHRWVVACSSDHSPTTMVTKGYSSDAQCILVTLVTDGTVVGSADFVSFDANGFTVKVTDVFPAVLQVSYVLLGGADLTNVACGITALTAALGAGNYTGLTAFQPDFGLFVNTNTTGTIPGGVSNSRLTIGAATVTSQALLGNYSGDGAATSITSSYCFSGAANNTGFEMFANLGGSTTDTDVGGRVSFVSFLSDGFSLNRLEGTGALKMPWLLLKGGSYAIGDFLTATNTTGFTEAHGMPVTPTGAMFFSANRAASTQDAATGGLEWSVGASDGTVNVCQYVRDKDASALADCFLAVYYDSCYVNASNATTQIIEGLGHVNATGKFDATNINFIMSTADPVQSFVWYVAFGNTPSAGRTTYNTRAFPLGTEIGMGWRMNS